MRRRRRVLHVRKSHTGALCGQGGKIADLTVIYNNEMWNAVRRNTREVYPDGYAARSNREPLTYFEPGIRYEKAIEALGGYGEQVVNGAALPAALDRALDRVAAGQQALLNVVCT